MESTETRSGNYTADLLGNIKSHLASLQGYDVMALELLRTLMMLRLMRCTSIFVTMASTSTTTENFHTAETLTGNAFG